MTLLINQKVKDAIALREVFSQIKGDSCPYHYNFHLHTNCSDGQLTPKQLIEQAIALGLQGLTITDHHSIDGFHIAKEYLYNLKEEYPRLRLPQLWTGIEITSNLMGVEVHILGYAFDWEHPRLQPYLSGIRPYSEDAEAATVIEAIQEAGGLAVLAHPGRYRSPAEKLIAQAVKIGVDGVEAYYAYGNPKPWFPSPKETEQIKELALFYNLLTTCGTDTHGSNILQRI